MSSSRRAAAAAEVAIRCSGELRLGFGAALALCESQGLVEQAQHVHF